VSDNALLSSLLAATLAGFSHAVTRPLILYVLKTRHLCIYKTIPLRTDALDRTFKGNWPLSQFMLKFTVTGEFLTLHDLGLNLLCVLDRVGKDRPKACRQPLILYQLWQVADQRRRGATEPHAKLGEQAAGAV
jgi:hypothetical protein